MSIDHNILTSQVVMLMDCFAGSGCEIAPKFFPPYMKLFGKLHLHNKVWLNVIVQYW